jgi:hypothetical protein
MSSTVKQGDTHAITFTVKDADGAPVVLDAATVLLHARRGDGGDLIVLPHTLGVDPGTITHQLDGTLVDGQYSLEIEVTIGGVVTTAPTDGFAKLIVTPDLG